MSTYKSNNQSQMPPDFTDPRSPLKGRSPVPWSKKPKTIQTENQNQDQIPSTLVKSFRFENDYGYHSNFNKI